MNMMELQRLTVEDKFVQQGHTKETLKAPSEKFNNLIVDLATAKPLWNFVVSDVRPYNKTVHCIHVYQHGEELGYIEWDYFRGDYGFEIGNDRIERARERTRAYKTQDEKKAMTAIKKSFSPMNVGERVSAAVTQAEKLIGSQVWDKGRKFSTVYNTMNVRASEFAKYAEAEFHQYLRTHNQFHVVEELEQAELEMKTLKDLQDNMSKCAVVIKVDGGYIVKTGDKVEMMDDTTLPDSMKAKLGMLKLVDDEHFITNVGGKIKADVFVLTPEGENDE